MQTCFNYCFETQLLVYGREKSFKNILARQRGYVIMSILECGKYGLVWKIRERFKYTIPFQVLSNIRYFLSISTLQFHDCKRPSYTVFIFCGAMKYRREVCNVFCESVKLRMSRNTYEIIVQNCSQVTSTVQSVYYKGCLYRIMCRNGCNAR